MKRSGPWGWMRTPGPLVRGRSPLRRSPSRGSSGKSERAGSTSKLRVKLMDVFGIPNVEPRDLRFSIEEGPSGSTIKITLLRGQYRFHDETVALRLRSPQQVTVNLSEFLRAVDSLRLSNRDKLLLKLRYWRRWSLDEIAENLNLGSSRPKALDKASKILGKKLEVKAGFTTLFVGPDEESDSREKEEHALAALSADVEKFARRAPDPKEYPRPSIRQTENGPVVRVGEETGRALWDTEILGMSRSEFARERKKIQSAVRGLLSSQLLPRLKEAFQLPQLTNKDIVFMKDP